VADPAREAAGTPAGADAGGGHILVDGASGGTHMGAAATNVKPQEPALQQVALRNVPPGDTQRLGGGKDGCSRPPLKAGESGHAREGQPLIDLGQLAMQLTWGLDVDVRPHVIDDAKLERRRQHGQQGTTRLLVAGKDDDWPLLDVDRLVDGGEHQRGALQRGHRPGVDAAHYQDDIGRGLV